MITRTDHIIDLIYRFRNSISDLINSGKFVSSSQMLYGVDRLIDELCKRDENEAVLYTCKSLTSCNVKSCSFNSTGRCMYDNEVIIYANGACSAYERDQNAETTIDVDEIKRVTSERIASRESKIKGA